MKSNKITKRPVGGGFLRKKDRNENLYQYHLKYPKLTHSKLAKIFKLSRARVTQILNGERNKHRKAQLVKADKPITKVCPDCKGSGKLPTGRRNADYPCLYCSGTGKITKTIREIIEEWMK